MSIHDYQSTVEEKISPATAFDKIGQVSKWWAKKTSGRATELGDAFRVDFGETWVQFEVVRSEKYMHLDWRVKDCNLAWLKDKKEWNGTTIQWDLKFDSPVMTVKMTHVGLTPDIECFANCELGWNFYVGRSLKKLFADDSGFPDQMGKVDE